MGNSRYWDEGEDDEEGGGHILTRRVKCPHESLKKKRKLTLVYSLLLVKVSWVYPEEVLSFQCFCLIF